jgi:para-nitrobenzyl esterase
MSIRVETGSGAVLGQEDAGVRSWLGIPYAAPPWGELRFAAPQPVAPWGAPREAFSYGPPAPQVIPLPGSAIQPSSDETPDCLTLNIWAPSDAAEPSPVMVWLHGGAFMAGTGGDNAYAGTALAREGAVVVTINYRLGVDGFAQIDGAVSNRGLLDQIAALEWLRENIAGFGGDPQRVTVFGESAGAASILALLSMPRAQGLLHRAIMQSIPNSFVMPDLARSVTDAVAVAAGVTADADSLASLSPQELAAATRVALGQLRTRADWGRVSASPSPFGPVVDADTLPEDPWSSLRDGAANEVPVILGHNRDEYRVFLMGQQRLGKITAEEADDAVRALSPRADADGYRALMPDADPNELFEKVYSDWLVLAPTMHAAEAALAGGGDVFVYELCLDPVGGIGSPHAIDLPLTFDTFEYGTGMLIPQPTEAERQTGARLRHAWVRFAAEGNPGWTPWSSERAVQIWGGDDAVVPYPERDRLDFSMMEPSRACDLVREPAPVSSSAE